ncbi:High-affinity zinc uptake system protein ZnuA precursor [Gammaproteobacteria bacterium MOLA455]|nr:High-affinity zinc uptake system protein ZnuA precursor [Gammaproteobacteria bacterium MOLA455]
MMKTLTLTKVIHCNKLLKIATVLSALTAQVLMASPETAKTLAQQPSTPKPLIITTIKPLAIIAQSAVGDQARVEYLQSAVQSAHEVSLPVSALKKIDQADLIIWIGEMFESRVAKPMALLPEKKRITVMQLPLMAPQDAGNQQNIGGHTHAHHGDSIHNALTADPHVWLNPQNANRIAAEIQQRLHLPVKEIISAEQIADFTTELSPLRDKQFLVHHDALDHFTSTFGLQPGLSIRDASGATQGVRSQYRLRQRATASSASCIFIEPQYADRDAQVIAQELSLPVALIDLQGLDQALVAEAYASFMQRLAAQFKGCFNSVKSDLSNGLQADS